MIGRDTTGSPSRVHYREQQILQVGDLVDEQRYRLEMQRRHNVALHGWGIVEGLELMIITQGSEQQLSLSPGLAVDGFGREIVVEKDQIIEDLSVDDVIDLWLLYQKVPLVRETFGAFGRDKISYWDHTPLVIASRSGEIDPQRPFLHCPLPNVAASDGVPDEGDREWPVALGRVRLHQGSLTIDPSLTRPMLKAVGELINAPSHRARMQVGAELSGDPRRFVVSLSVPKKEDNGTFIDRIVVDRNGHLAIQGNLRAENAGLFIADPWRFSVSDFLDPYNTLQVLTRADDDFSKQLRGFVGESGCYERLQKWERDGSDPTHTIALLGDWVECLNRRLPIALLYTPTAFEGITLRPELKQRVSYRRDVKPHEIPILNRMSIEDAWRGRIVQANFQSPHPRGIVFKNDHAVPEAAMPWHLYRTNIPAENEGDPESREMRMEIGHPGKHGDPSRYAFVVGVAEHADATSGDSDQRSRFASTLTVRADGQVEITGDLEIKGQLIQGPILPDAADPRYRKLVLDRWSEEILRLRELVKTNPLQLSIDLSKAVAEEKFSYPITVSNKGDTKIQSVEISSLVQVQNGGTSELEKKIGDLGPLGSSDENLPDSRTVTLEHDLKDVSQPASIELMVSAGSLLRLASGTYKPTSQNEEGDQS